MIDVGQNRKKNISRFRTINSFFLIFILVIAAAAVIGIILNITEDSEEKNSRILTLLGVVLLLFVLYAAANSILIRSFVLDPLSRLTESITKARFSRNEISGIDRDDEIGALAREMQKTWNRLNENNETLMSAMNDRDHRDQLLHTINIVAAILLDSDVSKFERSLYRCMGMMAATVDADRVYIWKNNMHQGELCATQIYEWSERVEPQQGKDNTINISYKEKMPEWGETLSGGKFINTLVRDIPDSFSIDFYSGALSVFLAPVFLQDQFWGFVGFDNCHREAMFSENEAAILRSGCLMIASAFLRHNNMTEIVNLQENLKEALKETQTASHAKSAFLAHMSHEIRTPMNSIVGFSELAMDDNIAPRTRDYLAKIIENAQWLLQIINDILDISKIESGKMELEKIPFDIGELFTNCKALIMPKAVEKGIELHFYVEPSTGRKPLGDPTRLRQVLVNLLSNAIKFTNAGMVKVFANIKEKSDNSVTMYFEVIDSGIGMTEEQIAKIFEPFTQAETGTTRQYGGTGLGLSITKNILELMGATLSVESRIGEGSKFSFILIFDTINITDEEFADNKVALDQIDKPVFEGEVLLCEDNAMNQQVICEHLSRVGLKTVVAENGKIGVDFVYNRMKKQQSEREKQFNLILMDIHMPVMDGLEASSKILEIDSGIPIIALTANIMPSDKDIYKAIGIIDCLGKPFTSQELWRCLLKYFTPISADAGNSDAARLNQLIQSDPDSDEVFRKKMRAMFVRNNQNKFSEIVKALKDDIKLAHRLTHTLKSNAGQIGKRALQQAATAVEQLLKNGKNDVTEELLLNLENELALVLNELSPLLDEISFMDDDYGGSNSAGKSGGSSSSASELSKTEGENEYVYALKILNILEPILKMGSPESCKLIDSIRTITGSGAVNLLKNQLMQQIDDFEFDQALYTSGKLKEEITANNKK